MTFTEDLKLGNEYEKQALTFFNYNKVHFPSGNFKEYDFILDDKIKIEVKCDRMAHITGNFAFEFKCFDKPSGITTTKADYYIYFIKYTGEAYKIPIKNILRACEMPDMIVKGGDYNKSYMYLIKRHRFKQFLIA